ncbi:MAG: hypothetical protein IIX28_03640 [Clostridia bacterium]|nr:hypothetical protein [Clostridia bacterium]
MHKLIRTSAIIAVVLKAVTTTLILMSFAFQPALFELFYSSFAADYGPVFPILAFIQSLWGLFAVIPLLICCGKKKGGIVLEAVMFGVLALVLPLANTATSFPFTNVIARTMDTMTFAAYSVANNIATYCAIPGNWGSAVAYAACGMSIVYKLMNKNQESVLAEN